MSLFAQLLEAALAQPESAPKGSFEESLRAFEDAIAIPAVVESSPLAPWAAALGVELPCTVQDLKRAFRRLAFETHPDRPGGSHGAFLRAQTILEEALASLRESPAVAVSAAQRYACLAGAQTRQARSTYA